MVVIFITEEKLLFEATNHYTTQKRQNFVSHTSQLGSNPEKANVAAIIVGFGGGESASRRS